jgi:hypothetical protein
MKERKTYTIKINIKPNNLYNEKIIFIDIGKLFIH